MTEPAKKCACCGADLMPHDHTAIYNAVVDIGGTRCTLCRSCMHTIVWVSGKKAAPGNKPLTAEQLRQMGGEPVFSPQCGWGIIGFRKIGTGEQEHSKKYTVGFSYGWEWLDDVMRIGPLYAHKPVQEEK